MTIPIFFFSLCFWCSFADAVELDARDSFNPQQKKKNKIVFESFSFSFFLTSDDSRNETTQKPSKQSIGFAAFCSTTRHGYEFVTRRLHFLFLFALVDFFFFAISFSFIFKMVSRHIIQMDLMILFV